jgi:NDP-sugar pyrophosphorylase family protein
MERDLLAVILCAGEGTRLKEITVDIPKPLIKIKSLYNKTILQYTIESLIKLGVHHIAVIKGYLGYKIDEFITYLTNENPKLKEKVSLINAGDDYKRGPLYSFLSITKNKLIFSNDYIYFIMPGDTIFEFNLLHKVFNWLQKNYNLIVNYPVVFYKRSNVKSLQINEISTSISNANIKKVAAKEYLNQIISLNPREIESLKYINQIIPISTFPYDLIIEITKLEKHLSLRSVREMINYMTKEGRNILAAEIKTKSNFYDIDYKNDLNYLERN